jgi:hypothetical protein
MVNYNAALLEQLQLLSLEASSWRGQLAFKSSEHTDSEAAFDLLDFVILNPGLQNSLKTSGNFPPGTQFRFQPEYKGESAKDKLVVSIHKLPGCNSWSEASHLLLRKEQVQQLPCVSSNCLLML